MMNYSKVKYLELGFDKGVIHLIEQAIQPIISYFQIHEYLIIY